MFLSRWSNSNAVFLLWKQFFLGWVLRLFTGGALHFSTFHDSVGRRAAENHHVTGPPQQAFSRRVIHHCNDGLHTGFRCPWDVVCERAGELDLETGDVADGETEHASEEHYAPKAHVSDTVETVDTTELSEEEHERQEEEAGVDVVVVGQFPDVTVHWWHHLLGVDGI